MPTTLGSLRRLVLTPALSETTFARRGFPVVEGEVTTRLEAVPQAVICGFEWGIDMRDQWELERRLELVEPEMRGFAYEGAAMALTVIDAMPGPRRHRARTLLTGPGRPHIFLTYIGIGFAMARLPRPLWKGVLPDLTGTPYFPTMSWLAVDGYGFDRAYFETGRWVGRQERLAAYPWQGRADYFPRVVDQGLGRALWFIHGARVDEIAAAVGAFAADRQADLWSGVGLAAAFAGGCDEAGLRTMVRLAGEHHPHLAQGAVFAAKARHFSGFQPEHTAVALDALTGMPVEAAAALADEVSVTGDGSDAEPDYEVWRRRIRAHFAVAAENVSR
ncbi:DUF1702 family protein [Actinoplanes sp. NPDC051861]|uniref:DUF1702 family protein n=1 Tax=Actinoplanes sp. NPDC051861 TaxID=3155170 RepID=UPI003430B529